MRPLLLLGLFGLSLYTHAQQPNIIFLLTDDQRWDALGYAGNEIIQTPEMDKLAQEGVYFKNAFVTTPICAASRASILTGQYERRHDYTFRKPPLSEEQINNSYVALLKKAGYYQGFLGKLGVNMTKRMDTALFEVYRPHRAGFYFRLTEGGTKHKHLTDIMGDQAIDFIENAPSDRPFCLSVSYNAPHAEDSSPEQYIWPPSTDSLYHDINIPAPRMASDQDFEAQPDYVKQGFNRTRWYWRFDKPEKYQKMVKGYYRMLSGIDKTIGQIRTKLEEKNLADNTIIILIGDNGYFLGERQFAGKWLMYEPSLRVPLIIYDPRNPQHRDIEDLALNVDIAPSILDFAGVDIPESVQGMSLKDYTSGGNPVAGREAFVCEHLWKFEPIAASEGIRTKKWKYFRYQDDPEHEELYDLEADPWEKENLATRPEYSKQLVELRKQFGEMVKRIE